MVINKEKRKADLIQDRTLGWGCMNLLDNRQVVSLTHQPLLATRDNPLIFVSG